MRGKKRNISEKINNYDFEYLFKKASNPREKIRFLAFIHIQAKKSYSSISKIIKIDRHTIGNWVKKFNKEGINGIKEKGGRGNKPKLKVSEEESFRKAVLELQDNRPGGRIIGLDILKIMEEKFNVKCSLSSVYNTLRRVKLVWISGRSKHPKADIEAQETFKKTSKK